MKQNFVKTRKNYKYYIYITALYFLSEFLSIIIFHRHEFITIILSSLFVYLFYIMRTYIHIIDPLFKTCFQVAILCALMFVNSFFFLK